MKTYLVGGAVRDKLMGITPKDRDYVIVGAMPADVQRLLDEGYEQVGADFPVFLHPTTGEEYALARVERKTGVGYHGFVVEADASVTIEDDLLRRDLTVNSMAMAEDGTLIDPYGGLKDLRNKILRHTSPAFSEDPLRVLRLARFAARYSHFTVATETVALAQRIVDSREMEHLSIERIWTELQKGFSEDAVDVFMCRIDEFHMLDVPSLIKIFGNMLTPQQLACAKHLHGVDQDARMPVSIAVLGTAWSDMASANNRVYDCFRAVRELRAIGSMEHTNAESMMLFMRNCRAFQNGPGWDDFIKATLIVEQAGERYCIRAKHLLTAQRLAKEVKAADFPGIEGKALGKAIFDEQRRLISVSLNIPMNK